MRDEHIKEILDGGPLAALGERELARVREHAARCDECLRAYRAAQASALMIKERVAHDFEPPPFFQTRVLAAIRARREAEPEWSFARLWKAAGALVSSMAVTVAALAALTFLGPEAQTTTARQEVAQASEASPAEELFFGADEELSDEQVFSTLYESEEGAAR